MVIMNFHVPCMESLVQMVNTLIFWKTFLEVKVKNNLQKLPTVRTNSTMYKYKDNN